MEKKLYRDEYRKKIGGVCAGLAEYFDMDVAIIRALFLLTFIFMGTGLAAYVVLWIVIPKRGVNFYNPNVDYRVPPEQPYSPFDSSGPVTPGAPFGAIPPKKSSSTAGVIIGCVLIFFGASFLLHELHVFYFWHMAKLWPVILIVVGLAVIVSGQKKEPWETGFQNTTTDQDVKATDDTDTLNKEEKKDDNITDTPPTI